jgi:hypothetical protein
MELTAAERLPKDGGLVPVELVIAQQIYTPGRSISRSRLESHANWLAPALPSRSISQMRKMRVRACFRAGVNA